MKILIVIPLLFILSSCIREDDFYYRFSHQQHGYLDTVIDFIAYARTEEEFDSFVNILIAEIARLHMLFNTFEPYENNLYMLNRNGYLEDAASEIIDLLIASKEAYEISKGRLNIAIGSVTNLWRKHGQNSPPTLPSLSELHEANQSTNIEHIIIKENYVRLDDKNMRLDVGAFAKAFTMYLATNKLIEETNIPSFLLNVGGDLIAHKAPLSPNRDTWTVGITNPIEPERSLPMSVPINSASFFTSGDYRRFFTVDEENFSHIIDPFTLFPGNYFRSVNVIHENILIAETLTTALFLMPIEEGINLAEEFGARVLWIDIEGRIIRTENF